MRIMCGNNMLVYFIYALIVIAQGGYALKSGILYPIESPSRELKSLNGIWHFRPVFGEKVDRGFNEGWFKRPLQIGDDDVELMAVPSSFNDLSQKKQVRDHIGWVFYSCTFWTPKHWIKDSRRIFLRFGSVTHNAVVWVNGHHLMNHTGGYLPFVGELTSIVKGGQENFIVVAVNNTLTPLTIPQGTLRYQNDTSRYPKGFVEQSYNFDYFNFAGIHRPVWIFTTPPVHIHDITLQTSINGNMALVSYDIEGMDVENGIWDSKTVKCTATVLDPSGVKVGEGKSGGGCSGMIVITDVNLWWPYLSAPRGETPGYLYSLRVTLTPHESPEDVDIYTLKFGVRSVQIRNNQFEINGQPFYFRGFGRHEDYNIRGRGVDPVLLIKDHNLLQWVGANSYRTSHYPYAEEILQLTDQLGIVVIDESPAIGLTGFGTSLMETHIQVMRELVQRDKNRPSVIMWSLGNEPKSMEAHAPSYFQKVLDATREADVAKRPITIVLSQNFFNYTCPSVDVISINRYFGWYGDTGRTEVIQLQIENEVESWYKSYGKPVLITEYGAGSIAGMHQNPSWVWTEDFQADYLMEHFKIFDKMRNTKEYFIGEMIWNFADFATPQETIRPWGCMKGIFTRDRQPKLAAHLVRWRYWKLANATQSNNELPNDLRYYSAIGHLS